MRARSVRGRIKITIFTPNGSSSVTFFTVAPQQLQKSNAEQKDDKVESPVKNRAIQQQLFVGRLAWNRGMAVSWRLASAAAERSYLVLFAALGM